LDEAGTEDSDFFGLTEEEWVSIWLYVRHEDFNVDLHAKVVFKERIDRVMGSLLYLDKIVSESDVRLRDNITSAIDKTSKHNMQLDMVTAMISFHIPEVWHAHAFQNTTHVDRTADPYVGQFDRYSHQDVEYLFIIHMVRKETKGAVIDFVSRSEAEYLIQTGLTLKMIDFHRNHDAQPIVTVTDDVDASEATTELITDFHETDMMINLLLLPIAQAMQLLSIYTYSELMNRNRYGRYTFMYIIKRRYEDDVVQLMNKMFELHPTHIRDFFNARSGNGESIVEMASKTWYPIYENCYDNPSGVYDFKLAMDGGIVDLLTKIHNKLSLNVLTGKNV
jgi:hypothetical protein